MRIPRVQAVRTLDEAIEAIGRANWSLAAGEFSPQEHLGIVTGLKAIVNTIKTKAEADKNPYMFVLSLGAETVPWQERSDSEATETEADVAH